MLELEWEFGLFPIVDSKNGFLNKFVLGHGYCSCSSRRHEVAHFNFMLISRLLKHASWQNIH